MTKIPAIGYRRFGPPNVLEHVSLPMPKIGANEVLVAVEAIGLNPLDYRLRRGDMVPFIMPGQVRVIASDFAGRVHATGTKVRRWAVGDRVHGMVNQVFTGSAAQLIAVADKVLAPCPEGLEIGVAATVPLASLTAWQALTECAVVQPGMRVLVNGASGGVGVYGVQIARAFGAEVTAVTSYRNLDWMSGIGATETLDYTTTDFTVGPAKFDVIFDAYGNRSFGRVRPALAKDGTYITTIPGVRGYLPMLVNGLRAQKAKVVVVRGRGAHLGRIDAMMTAGHIKPIVDRVYPVDELEVAYGHLESKRACGKIGLLCPWTPP